MATWTQIRNWFEPHLTVAELKELSKEERDEIKALCDEVPEINEMQDSTRVKEVTQ